MIIVFVLVALFPLLGCLFAPPLLSSFDYKRQLWGGVIIAFMLGIIAFNFAPLASENTDLIRHFSRMKLVQNYSYGENLSSAFDSLPLFYLILKLFSYCSSPHCLPFWSTFLGYGIMFVLVIKHSEHYQGGKFSSSIGIFSILCLTSFLGYCSGIFQYLTFILFCLFIYLDLYREERKYKVIAWIGYICLLFLHSSAVLLLLIRILLYVSRRYKGLRVPVYIFCLLWSKLQDVAIQILNRFAAIPKISYLENVINGYIENPSHGNIYQDIIRISALILFGALAFFLKRKISRGENSISKEDGNYAELLFIVVLFTIGAYFQYDVFTRFTMLVVFIGAPLIGLSFKTSNLSKTGNSFLFIMLLGYCTVSLLYYFINGYFAFNYNDVFEILFTNVVTILKGMFA